MLQRKKKLSLCSARNVIVVQNIIVVLKTNTMIIVKKMCLGWLKPRRRHRIEFRDKAYRRRDEIADYSWYITIFALYMSP